MLGLDPTAPVAETRRALLRIIRAEGFFLDPASQEAVAVLSDRDAIHAPRLHEVAARGEVEAFAAEYFDLPAKERRGRWNSLVASCASSEQLLERLRTLEPGIELDRSAIRHGTPLVERLASHALDLHLLPPAKRAARRRELVVAIQNDPLIGHRGLVRAIRSLRRSFPAVAALAPDLLTDLTRPKLDRKIDSPTKGVMSLSKESRNWQAIWIGLVCLSSFIRIMSIYHSPKSKLTDQTAERLPAIPQLDQQSMDRMRQQLAEHRIKDAEKATMVANAFAERMLANQGIAHDETEQVRRQYADQIRRQLAKHGKTLDESRLMRIVDAIRVQKPSRGSSVSGNKPVYLLISDLRRQLRHTDLGLTESQIDEIARGTFAFSMPENAISKTIPLRSRSGIRPPDRKAP
jgi:hypothetical protein